jgi:FkbM family methyltransferase
MNCAAYDNFTYRTDDPIFLWHISKGLSEPYPRELGIVKRYLSEYPERNHLCIDVGGHIGTTSLPYSRLFQQVVAYEPNQKNYAFFLENIRLNSCSNIQVKNKGVYHKNTSCVVVPHSGGNSGCFYIKEDTQHPHAIPVVRLDDEFQNTQIPIDFLKIDTEGSEFHVLFGAQELIKRWKPLIQVETNGLAFQNYNIPETTSQKFLEGFGYKIYDSNGHNPFFYCP